MEHELKLRREAGVGPVSMAEMVRLFGALGYRFDRSMDCKGTARDVNSGHSYECNTLYPVEADTGRSAWHYESRRDANYRAMQTLRLTTFAVVRGRIVEV